MAELLAETRADGFNGDTMDTVPEEFFTAAEKLGVAAAIEPEGGGSADTMAWTTFGWGYWAQTIGEVEVPPVDKFKWLEPRRLTHVCNRWAQDHTTDLHYAFFNGNGFEAWENVGMRGRNRTANRQHSRANCFRRGLSAS